MLDNKIKVGFIGWYSPEDKKALNYAVPSRKIWRRPLMVRQH